MRTASNRIEMVGKTFGRLTVLELVEVTLIRRQPVWKCRCECGKTVNVEGYNLRRGNTQSCGCLQKERTSSVRRKHGMSYSAEYKAWQQAKNRCFNTKHPAYPSYGGRGITMFAGWVNDFDAFLAALGPRPFIGRPLVLDRIDNDRGYVPGNVRWTLMSISNRNKRHGNEGQNKLPF